MKWAQREHTLILTIPSSCFKYTKLQLSADKIWFMGVSHQGDIYEVDHALLNKVDTAKSG